jgi:integrase/recombinase XerC
MVGIIREASGYRAYIYAGGQQKQKRFPPDTPLQTMKNWRDETRVSLRKLAGKRPKHVRGALKWDIARYLKQVRSMPTYAQRREHLLLWMGALGANTFRADITVDMIRAVLQTWRQAGMAPATCNKRRSALMHLWTLLDGKDARNPVRAVRKFRVDDPLPRGRDPHAIDAKLLAAPRCRSRASCRVMLWTGMRPVELNRAEPDDVDTASAILVVRTAKGGRTRVVPLTKQAISAWKEFRAADAWQRVPNTAPLNRWIKKATGMDLRVYDLRHSYGTALATRQTRLDVIGSLMGHSTLDLTRRYTLAAVTPDALSATGRLAVRSGGHSARRQNTRKIARA